MSTTTRKPRPRLYGKLSKPAPISFTDLQHTMHTQSSAMRGLLTAKTRGAFGGVSKLARVKRDADKAPKDLLPPSSPLS